MTKRMLIDDTQPEETRVVIVNGNKLEDVEFESSSRKQIKGNIYLAKVMRIEPSLQAAFVDYGGNRHGFLAFGEIHPDYYHVDEKTLAELEQEVDTIIENKKQAIKERELERARIREEKALKRAQRLEQEAAAKALAEAEAQLQAQQADASNQEQAEAPAQTESNSEIQSSTEAETSVPENKVEEKEASYVQPVDAIFPENKEIGTEISKKVAQEILNERSEILNENIVEEKSSEEIPAPKKRGRKPKKVQENNEPKRRGRRPKVVQPAESETTQVSENSEDAHHFAEASANSESKDEAKSESAEIKENDAPVKTLAESIGTESEKIVENSDSYQREENDDDDDDDEVETNNISRNADAADDEVAADDDDDSEYDFEIQKKLLLMRKLFHQSKIQDVIKEGQILLVQVVKEERGNKGAALTTYLSLAGRYCVLMPNRIKSGGVSRKITNAADRKRLKGIVKELPISSDMSLIVRTAGEEKTKSDIVRDYNYLIRTWDQIRLDSLKMSAPCLVYEEGNLIKRALRDMFTKEISEIIIDGNNAYQAAKNFMRILSPHSMKKLKSCKANDIPLFQRFQVEGQLDKLHDTNVQLESGGYLVINPTEALVSIDVNSGRATKEKDLEETALKTNLEAADEIAKQLRMRNLAGLVVIDFIDMDDPKNNTAIEKRMKEAMKMDRARVQIGKMSCFGLLEISRQRMHSSFFESNYQVCPYCHGRGIIRTIESGAISILRTIEEEGSKGRSSKIVVSLPRDVAVYLLNQKRTDLVEIESRYNMQVIICADESIKNVSDFRVERTKVTKPTEEKVVKTEPENIVSEDVTEVEENVAAPEEAKDTHNEQADIKSEDGDNDNSRRRNGRRDRRNRFDRRRGNKRRFETAQAESETDKGENASEDETADGSKPQQAENEGNNSEKRKVAWWKKLING